MIPYKRLELVIYFRTSQLPNKLGMQTALLLPDVGESVDVREKFPGGNE